MDSYSQLLDKVQYDLNDENASGESFDTHLESMSQLVSQTSASENLRQEIGNSKEVCESLNNVLESYDFDAESQGNTLKRQRIFRGLLILIRNLSVVPNGLIHEMIFSSMEKFIDRTEDLVVNINTQTLIAFHQIWANIVNIGCDTSNISTYSILRKECQCNIIFLNLELETPILIVIRCLLRADDKVRELLSNVENEVIIDQIINRFDRIDFSKPLQSNDLIIIEALEAIISNESYTKFLNKWISNRGEQRFLDLMKVNQLTITAKEDWDNYQIVSLMSWLYDLFKAYGDECKTFLNNNPENKEPTFAHSILVIVLDCISDLCKFSNAKQFLHSYGAIEPLITLLRVVHENTSRGTMKKKIETDSRPKFPHVKSLIIEIVAYLSYESFATQERIRELHGIELLLSNCVIDDNDPFIKERSIMCLKFVLAGNQENQKFVSELEAQEAYDESALNDIGYEVNIADGKLSMRKKN